jgi:hypothetical protein
MRARSGTLESSGTHGKKKPSWRSFLRSDGDPDDDS